MMNRTSYALSALLSALLLCSCSSAEKVVEISLYDTYVTGSFVHPTTPDQMRVYVDNAPLPLSTEVIGEFRALDPVSKRKATLDELLDTVKKDACDFGANALFLTTHDRPRWDETGVPHYLEGLILLQPDTVMKKDREHPLNTSYGEYLAKQEAERIEAERNYNPHYLHLSAGYSSIGFTKDAIVSDVERELTDGVGFQGGYEYKFYKINRNYDDSYAVGLLYKGYYDQFTASGFLKESAMNHALFVTLSRHTTGGKHFLKYTIGFGRQWENICLQTLHGAPIRETFTAGRGVIYYGLTYEYRMSQHWGLAASLSAVEWGIPFEGGYSNETTFTTGQFDLSVGINYHC